MTPANAIVKAYQDLMQSLHGIPNTKGAAHMEALTKMQEFFEPCHNLPITPTPFTMLFPQSPMVKFTKATPKVVTYRIQVNPLSHHCQQYPG